MTKALALVAGVAVGAALVPSQARADEAARVLPYQLADAITTRVLLRRPCTFERDPLARPAVRSDLGAVASAVVLNLAFRRFGAKRGFLRIVAGTEALAVANNVRDIARATGPDCQ
jgi:hypothetical protein